MWDKTQLADFRISIHAPRMGSDYTSDQIVHCKFLFQSTLPGWGATERARPTCRVSLISIHAPRMGSDVARHVHRGTGRNFNPRSPDGERPALRANSRKPCSNFNPRSPDGERLKRPCTRSTPQHFNPRSPDGERPRKWTSSPTIWAKSSIFNTDCIADRR